MPKPNILIIIADDIGVDAFRIDKAAKTVTAQVTGTSPAKSAGPASLPTFQRMLRSGVHFEQAWAHPVCTPTRASLWTGVQPWKTSIGYPLGGDLLPTNRNLVSLPQALEAAQSGYRCAMFGKWDLGGVRDPADPAKDQNPVKTWGWDHFAGIYRGGLRADGTRDYKFSTQDRVGWDRLNGSDGNPTPDIVAKRKAAADALKQRYELTFLRNNPDLRFYIWEKDVVGADQRTAATRQTPAQRQFLYATEDQVEDAKAWLDDNRDAGPWCIALNLITPHDPFHVPPPGSYGATTIKDPTKPSVQELVVAMLESMDHYVGKLITAIGEQLENTVIIFVGDNGTQDKDIDTQEVVDGVEGDDKGTEVIGGVHVPMIVADGGVMMGRTPCFVADPRRSVGSPVHIIDVYDTVLDIAGATKKPANDSTSMAPLLRAANGTKRTHNFSQMYAPYRLRPGHTDEYECPGISASASDGTFKLTCRVLRKPYANEDWLYIVDLAGNPSTTPYFEYVFCKLVPDAKIPGSFVEKPIDAIARNPDVTSFSITKQNHSDKILELYEVLRRERLDATPTEFPRIDAKPPFHPAGTKWSVAELKDDGALGSFHPTLWEFAAGTMQAKGSWSGTYAPIMGRTGSFSCRIADDAFETHFVTPKRFVCTRNGALFRFGKRTEATATPTPDVAAVAGAPGFQPAGTKWSVAEMKDDGTIDAFHAAPWEFDVGTMQAKGFWTGTYTPIPGRAGSFRGKIGTDTFAIHFVSPTRFVCTKNGALFRFGKLL